MRNWYLKLLYKSEVKEDNEWLEEMRMKITEDMVTVFNQTLENLNCSFRLKFENGMCGNGQCVVVPSNNMFIHSSIINLTEEFYEVLEDFFSKRASCIIQI